MVYKSEVIARRHYGVNVIVDTWGINYYCNILK